MLQPAIVFKEDSDLSSEGSTHEDNKRTGHLKS
jgi:hypothetical protein